MNEYLTDPSAFTGIPESILAERRKADVCLKCGKKGHSWGKCWTQDPVVARVAATRKRKKADEPEASALPESKKAKAAAVAAVHSPVPLKAEPERSLFVVDEDSDPEIY